MKGRVVAMGQRAYDRPRAASELLLALRAESTREAAERAEAALREAWLAGMRAAASVAAGRAIYHRRFASLQVARAASALPMARAQSAEDIAAALAKLMKEA